jgi:hypothetical protein
MILNTLLGVTLALYFFYIGFFQNRNHVPYHENKYDNLFVTVIISTSILFLNLLYTALTSNYLRNLYVKEMLTIVHTAKLPKKCPKVVYVYTTHNDFLPTRLLQNINQTYKNFEV